MAKPTLTATLPDGKIVTRKTDHKYIYVIAGKFQNGHFVKRNEWDTVKSLFVVDEGFHWIDVRWTASDKALAGAKRWAQNWLTLEAAQTIQPNYARLLEWTVVKVDQS